MQKRPITDKEREILPELIRLITIAPIETQMYLLGYAQAKMDDLPKGTAYGCN